MKFAFKYAIFSSTYKKTTKHPKDFINVDGMYKPRYGYYLICNQHQWTLDNDNITQEISSSIKLKTSKQFRFICISIEMTISLMQGTEKLTLAWKEFYNLCECVFISPFYMMERAKRNKQTFLYELFSTLSLTGNCSNYFKWKLVFSLLILNVRRIYVGWWDYVVVWY